jgi:hypothetical protein
MESAVIVVACVQSTEADGERAGVYRLPTNGLRGAEKVGFVPRWKVLYRLAFKGLLSCEF